MRVFLVSHENCRVSSSKHSYSAVTVIMYLVRNSTQLAPILDLCAVYLCLWLSFQHCRNDSGRVDRGRWMLTADHLAFLWISFETILVFILWFMLRNSLSGNLYAIFIQGFAVIKYRNTIECHCEFGSLSVTNAAVAVSNGIHQTAAPFYLRHQFLSSSGESASNWWLRPQHCEFAHFVCVINLRERRETSSNIY